VGHWRAHLPVLLSSGYLVHLVINNTYDRSVDYPTKHIPAFEYAITQFKVHWTYLRLVLLPVNQNLDYDYPVSKTLFELPTLLSFAGYIGLWTGGILIARKSPLAAFSVLWFLVALLPASFGVILPRGLKLDDVIFEHRLYLAMAGLMALPGMAAPALCARLHRPLMRAVAVAAFAVLVLSLSAASFARNSLWWSNKSIWEDAVSKSPGKARAHFNLGVAYGVEAEKAIEQYRIAMHLDPSNPKSYVHLARLYRSMGRTVEALDHYKIALGLDPDNPEALRGLGILYASQGAVEQAINQYRLAISRNPNDAIAHANLGIAYKKANQDKLAAEHLSRARSLNPGIAEAFLDHGKMYLSMGFQVEMAIEQFEKALAVDPDLAEAHNYLGAIYRAGGEARKAREHLDAARRLGEKQGH
jgi:tetratricopeptide (TPR) repeat protein